MKQHNLKPCGNSSKLSNLSSVPDTNITQNDQGSSLKHSQIFSVNHENYETIKLYAEKNNVSPASIINTLKHSDEQKRTELSNKLYDFSTRKNLKSTADISSDIIDANKQNNKENNNNIETIKSDLNINKQNNNNIESIKTDLNINKQNNNSIESIKTDLNINKQNNNSIESIKSDLNINKQNNIESIKSDLNINKQNNVQITDELMKYKLDNNLNISQINYNQLLNEQLNKILLKYRKTDFNVNDYNKHIQTVIEILNKTNSNLNVNSLLKKSLEAINRRQLKKLNSQELDELAQTASNIVES